MSIPKSSIIALACLVALAVQAEPVAVPAQESETRPDMILRLMVDRGLVPIDAATYTARQVRDTASDLVISAFNYLGVRYRRGGNSVDEGFDCSGFVRYIFKNSVGLVLPRRADEQAQAAGVVPITADELKPGDLVFFNTLARAFSHVGIYVGDGKFIHSPRTGFAIRVEDMGKDYWVQRFNGARRVTAIQSAAAPEASSRVSSTR
jgi:cell wall-associated NlpC family hydrolase